VLTVNGVKVDFVSNFTYLGFVVTTSMKSFSRHLAKRKINATMNLYGLPDLKKLAISPALKLFALKIAPCMYYGIRPIWSHLSLENLRQIESVKTTFLKRLMGISKHSRNRITYLLTGCKPFVQDIQELFQLEKTDAYLALVEEIEGKLAEVDTNVFCTPAFRTTTWQESLAPGRHIKCRAAAHGFHHKFCQISRWHEAGHTCICRFCANQCSQYHFLDCARSPFLSLADLDTAM
jgi:hypothetical protein